MVRAGSPKTQAARRKRTRKLTKGFRLSRHNLFRQAIVTLIRSRVYAFRDRKAKKRQYRRMWIVRINAACRMRGLRYSEFIHGLQLSFVALDRKSMSEIAIHDPATFDKLVEIAKTALASAAKAAPAAAAK
ncbi:50s ribosomal protein l20 : 50S ribosomal protein L20 OS=Rhodopirellula sallentina SM41 GN=rplT PE=3 SV=1: Ribosomal_L20 [Gemmataceae bacterium]|nr:50s ribosomal protein l20 : 50S ribosomal protein L20 OS=Rhodopirellula sallentina SM41 GN=rplT PE=3 SV=1: Ribosomal_L20 [Gemmataceae bacterium]VTT97411.1 50s ribosomal protein l20 : 50S ribosomal protein L20 OS=Rhodopirellula sallentina SM41 GN=rplT PE=3 SV=1: Ribosomal_L20 [Gemmataceae bacterium]